MNGKNETSMNTAQRISGFAAAVYLALAYLAGIVIFIFVLRYPEIQNVSEKMRIVVEMKSMVFLTNVLMYVFFGPALVVFILALKARLSGNESIIMNASVIIGFIWAGSLTASGMIANAAIGPIIELASVNPEQALLFWHMLDTVSVGIGNGNGEILGGLMSLGFGLAMCRDSTYSRGIGIFGIIIGLMGVASVVPLLADMTALFGILQLIWFVLVGVSFMKTRKA